MWYVGSIVGACLCSSLRLRLILTLPSRVDIPCSLRYRFRFNMVVAGPGTRPSLGTPSPNNFDLVGLPFPFGLFTGFVYAPHNRFVPESPRWLISKGSVSFLCFRLWDCVKQLSTTGKQGSANTCSLSRYWIR